MDETGRVARPRETLAVRTGEVVHRVEHRDVDIVGIEIGPRSEGVDIPFEAARFATVAGLLHTQDMPVGIAELRSEEHTSELQSLMRISYAVFCLKKKIKHNRHTNSLYTQHNY